MKTNKRWNLTIGNVLAGIALVLAVLTIYTLFIMEDEYNCACDVGICGDDLPVSGGGVKADFLMERAEDFEETSEFCKTKGYDTGVLSGSIIFCQDEERYKKFRVMTDFVGYLYEKYKK